MKPAHPSGALQTFLGRHCHFPFARPAPDFSGLARATLVVEQSFSDFGDLDLLILLDYSDGRKRAVLAEAKVATDTGCPATIRDQWDDFLAFLGGDATKTSSLFVQLYRKVRLMEQVSDLNTRLRPDAASRRWSLGNNRVVLRGRTAPLRIPREPAVPGDRPRRGAWSWSPSSRRRCSRTARSRSITTSETWT